ncbi:MAG: HAD hydrolase-like protein [Planctomycetota bacterium]
MNVEGIIFDMDGVLVDVSASYRVAIKKTVEYYLKKRVNAGEIRAYKTKSGYNNDWDITEAIMLSRGLRINKTEIIRIFQKFYLGSDFDGLIANEKWLLDIDILSRLKQDYKLGIVTGRPRKDANHTLKRFKARKYFDTVITMDDVDGKYKPDPYGINLALKELNIRSRNHPRDIARDRRDGVYPDRSVGAAAPRALYAGDNIDDIKSAVSAKVIPVGIIGPHIENRKKAAELYRKLGAKYILKNINEIPEVLKCE